MSRYEATPSGGTSSARHTDCSTSFPGKNTASVTEARKGKRVKNTRADRRSRRAAESNGSSNSRCILKVHYMMGGDDAHDHNIVGHPCSRLGGMPLETGAEALPDARRGQGA